MGFSFICQVLFASGWIGLGTWRPCAMTSTVRDAQIRIVPRQLGDPLGEGAKP